MSVDKIDFKKHLGMFSLQTIYNDIFNDTIYEGYITLINNSTFVIDEYKLLIIKNANGTNETYLHVNNRRGDFDDIIPLPPLDYKIMDFFFFIALYHEDLKLFYYSGNSVMCTYSDDLMRITYNHVSEFEPDNQKFKKMVITAYTEEDFYYYNLNMNTTRLCAKEYPGIIDEL